MARVNSRVSYTIIWDTQTCEILPEVFLNLASWWGLCGHVTPRSMLAVAYATGKASHARQFGGDDSDEWLPWPSRLGFGREANNPTQ